MATLAAQLVQRTKAAIYDLGLALATDLGVVTTSWVVGDPTRSLYHFVAEMQATLEVIVAGFIAAGFLDYAERDWLTLLAKQVFNVDRVEGTYATTTVTLTNAGGGTYTWEAGDLTAQDSTTGKTFRNTTGGTLGPVGSGNDTLDLTFVADEPGSDSSAFAGDIDTLVTSFLGVTCSNANAALGTDDEEDDDLRSRCRAKLGMLSPNGPADAYNYVVRSSDLTGVTDIARSRTLAESTTGDVTVYVASSSGAVAGASVTAAQTAVERWATPGCITPTVTNVSAVTVPVTYQVWLYTSVGESTGDIADTIEDALATMFAARPIGGDIIAPATSGKLYKSLIEATIKAAYPAHTFRVSVSSPAGDTSLTIGQVAALGTVTPTVTLEVDP